MNLIDFFLSQSKRDPDSKSGKVICSDCETVLINYKSMDAGMGPVCLSRTRFIESIDEKHLASFEGKRKFIPEAAEFKTGIFKEQNSESLKYITILKKDDNSFIYIDRKSYNKLYNSGLSATESILSSLNYAESSPGSTIASVSEPKEEELIKQFKEFVSNYREELSLREKNFSDFGLSTIETKKNLSLSQRENRKDFVKNYKTKYSDEFKEKWSSGEYSISTMISRLDSSSVPGAKELAVALLKNNPNARNNDYGLTDDEISLGLQQAEKPLEKKIFSAVMRGEDKLSEISKLYEGICSSPSSDLYFKFHTLIT